MPYVIETKTPARDRIIGEQWHHVSYRAVATLDEAREITWNLLDASPATDQIEEHLTKAGGKIGPLPDGTVIEVAEVDYVQLRARAGIPFDDRFGAEIIAAYNAMQEG